MSDRQKRIHRIVLVGVALGLASCASPAKLARQSSAALAKGDLSKALDRAERAVEHDPQNQAAREAYAAATTRVAADYRMRVVAAASADTLAAADLALEYQHFRAEVARHGTALDTVPDYTRAERTILRGAARAHYRRGIDAMAARRPKVAVNEFTVTQRYDDRFEDVASRLADARSQATMRVAVLPFVDRTGVPGLSQEVADVVQREVSNRAGSEFRYTLIASATDIEHNMTVAEARNLRPDDAMEIGRRIGADWVVVGRIRGLRSTDSRHAAKFVVFRRVDYKDSTGAPQVRWDDIAVPVVTRERDVTVQVEFDVVDVVTGAVLAHRDRTAPAFARVAWTDFRADEHEDRYALLPPDVRRADPRRAKAVDTEWHDEMGSWDLRDFLRASREQRSRTRYTPRFRSDFYSDTREHPVWLNELPPENDLAFVALRELWRDVLAALRELDQKT